MTTDKSADEPRPVSAIGRLLVHEVHGELVILDTREDQVHQLNRTASEIWRLASQGTDPSEIAKELAFRFEVDTETAERDVEATLHQFRTIGLCASE
jgi:hypothetical protein